MADPAIGELSFFCEELGNMDQGIVLSWKNEKITLFLSVLKEKDTGLAQTSWESYQPQMSSASHPSELYLQAAIQDVGPVWGLVPP